MKSLRFLLWVLLTAAAQLQCDHAPTAPREPKNGGVAARIGVFVQYDGIGVPGIRVQLVETGEMRVTDAHGRVEFEVAGGDYVVRVYDLTRPGPATRTEDYPITIKPGAQEIIKVLDCLPCV